MKADQAGGHAEGRPEISRFGSFTRHTFNTFVASEKKLKCEKAMYLPKRPLLSSERTNKMTRMIWRIMFAFLNLKLKSRFI